MERIKVVTAEPGGQPVEAEIDNTLEAMQKVVDGYIEGHVIPGTYFMLFVNEDGRMRGLPHNRRLWGFAFCGTMLITKVNQDGENVSMDEDEIKIAKEMLS